MVPFVFLSITVGLAVCVVKNIFYSNETTWRAVGSQMAIGSMPFPLKLIFRECKKVIEYFALSLRMIALSAFPTVSLKQ